MRRAVALTASLAALLLCGPAPARAGAPIAPRLGAHRPDTLAAGEFPSPHEASRRSAESTMIPVAVGGIAFVGDLAAIGSGYVALGGYGVAVAGLVLGPASGYHYGRLPRRGTLGAALRLALVVGPPLAVAWTNRERPGWEDDWHSTGMALLGGTALAATFAVYDIAVVGPMVERRNQSVAGARASLAPAVAPFSHAPGLAVRVALPPGD